MATSISTGNQRKARIYRNDVRGLMDIQQNLLALQIMRDIGQPQTIRMIHRIINSRGFQIDLVSLRRSITNLEKTNPRGEWENQFGKKMVQVAFEKQCPITHKTVGWYELIQQQLPLFQ